MEDVMTARAEATVEEGSGLAAETDLLTRAKSVAALAAARADTHDCDGAFPLDEIGALHRQGLLAAPFPSRTGGHGLGVGDPDRCRDVLAAVGRGSLPLGRLFEGHVNAVALVTRYGNDANLGLLLREAEAGRPSGVWMAGPPLRLERTGGRYVLHGKKLLCSGAGHFERPLVAADFDGGSVMVIPRVADPARIDTSAWTAQGMRATATGTVDFGGISVGEEEMAGRPGDYLRSPYFRGGAWRVIAVQLGGLAALLEHYRRQLGESPHREHPVQLARYGEALIAVETAHLWVRQASRVAEGPYDDAAAVDAYVDLARNAFEGAALQAVACAQKAIGLKSFLRPNPLERVIRDLTTYLRQPALDASLASAAAFHLAAIEQR